jgi:hypothetical protein
MLTPIHHWDNPLCQIYHSFLSSIIYTVIKQRQPVKLRSKTRRARPVRMFTLVTGFGVKHER